MCVKSSMSWTLGPARTRPSARVRSVGGVWRPANSMIAAAKGNGMWGTNGAPARPAHSKANSLGACARTTEGCRRRQAVRGLPSRILFADVALRRDRLDAIAHAAAETAAEVGRREALAAAVSDTALGPAGGAPPRR